MLRYISRRMRSATPLTISAPSCDGSTWTRNGRLPNGMSTTRTICACDFGWVGIGGFEAGETLQRLVGDAGIGTGFVFGGPRRVRRLAGMGEVVGALGEGARHHDRRLDAPQRKLGRIGHRQRIHRRLGREIGREERRRAAARRGGADPDQQALALLRRCGSAARLTRWVPRTLTSYCWMNWSGVKASAGPNTMWPALWTMTSRRPASAMMWAMPASADASDWTSSSTVRRSACCSAAQSATAATWGALRPCGLAHRGVDGVAGLGQRAGGHEAEARGRAGDEDDVLGHERCSFDVSVIGFGGWEAADQMIPPLARSVWPLIQAPSGPARKATASAMSSGWPSRSSGASLARRSITSCGLPLRNSLVAVGPGAIALTVMFRPRSSLVRMLVIASTAALVAA